MAVTVANLATRPGISGPATRPGGRTPPVDRGVGLAMIDEYVRYPGADHEAPVG